MNPQPSAEEQVTVNVTFIEGDQFSNSRVPAMETKQDPVLSSILRPDSPNTVPQTYVRVHISCSHMGPGADKAAHAHTWYSVWRVHSDFFAFLYR